MEKKNEYTVRVAYKVCDYWDIEAASEEKAVEEALEIAGESSLYDFIRMGDGEAVVTQVNRKPVKPKKPEAQYVWVFTAEQAYDYDSYDVIVRTFATEESARKFLHDFVYAPASDGTTVDSEEESVAQYAERNGWDVEYDEPDFYMAYAEGSYPSDHVECRITKCEVEK